MIAVLKTDGELSPREIGKECKKDKWVPLASKEGKVILFRDVDIATSFIKRNIPRSHLRGHVFLTDIEIQNLPDTLILDFPRKMETEAYIHYLTENPNLHVS